MSGRDPSAEQLNGFKKAQGSADHMTTGGGAPVGDKLNIQTVGPRGPALLQDVVFLDEMSHFDRERIPERVVHAKGAGAFGYFEVTHDITQYSKAKIFEHIGKKTPLLIRFSTVGGEKGSADTARDPRGFAMKFYTEEGNWDLVGNNTPIFFIRDPMLFPSFIHTQKRNPVTNLKDHDMFWDFISLRPETTHQVSFLFSERGTPDGLRHMNGYGSHTFKLVNAAGEAVYCKFHCKTDQGIKNLLPEKADELCGSDPDYATRDLFNSISKGNFPSWTMYIQVMTFEEAEKFRFNPFDLTKVWPHSEYPLIPVGRLTLNRNAKNYHAEIEQSAFAPSNMVPGIEASPDKMLQGRLFSYHDTHIHRLGTNYLQIPVNCPYNTKVGNYQRDGFMSVTGNQEGAPNYYPNSFSGPQDSRKFMEHRQTFTGTADVTRFNSDDEDNFTQAGIFYSKVLSAEERTRLVNNIAGHLSGAQEFIQKRAVRNFAQADPEYGRRIQECLDKLNAAAAPAGQMENRDARQNGVEENQEKPQEQNEVKAATPDVMKAEEQDREEEDNQSEGSTEGQYQVQAEDQYEVQAEVQSEVKAEVQSEVKAEDQNGVQAEDQNGVQAEDQNGVQAEDQNGVQAENQNGVKAEDQNGVQAEDQREVEAEYATVVKSAERKQEMIKEQHKQAEETFSLADNGEVVYQL